MKKIYRNVAIWLLAALGASSATSCTDESASLGQGSVLFNIDVDEQVEVKTRSVNTAELEKNCVLYVYQGNNIVRKYRGVSRLEELVLYSGQYKAEAYAGEYMPASFDKQYFEGSNEFTVTNGVVSNVSVTCKIANTLVSVSTDENVGEVLSDLSFEVSHSEGSLTFAGETFGLKGYFMMPPKETALKYTLRGKNLTGDHIGGEFIREGVIEDVKPATEYAVTVTYNKHADLLGGAYFDIVIDENELLAEHQSTLEAAPHIAAPNDEPLGEVVVRKDELSHYVVYVASTTELKNLDIACERFPSMEMQGEFDLITSSAKADIESYGITMEDKTPDKDAEDGKQLTMIEFNETFFEKLNTASGEFVINFSATDANDLTTNATLTITITEDKVIAAKAPSATYYNSVILKATLADENAGNPGFEYREADITRAEGDWTRATDVTISGTAISARLSGLRAGTRYEYRVVWDGMATNSPVYDFTTKAYPQVQNAGFETWGSDGSIILPAANMNSRYWDCGNHGSSTMGINVTNKDSDIKHSGSYSAKLRSQFVGIGSIGKFAAGNIFIGQYLKTDGTDGVIGFGRPFDFPNENGTIIKPKAVKLWVRYEPGIGTKSKGANSKYIGEGQTDKGQIYIALCGESADPEDKFEGVSYARVVRTKNAGRLFDKDAANVAAYGEHIFTETTAGSGMVEMTIPFDDVHPAVTPKYLVIVASASMYGDFFSGGEGSTMWIDDIELVYE